MPTADFETHNLDESIRSSRPKHLRLYIILLYVAVIIILAAIFAPPYINKSYASWQAAHAPTQQQIVAQLMQRPLRVPSLTSGQSCPISSYRLLSNDPGHVMVYGISPVFLSADLIPTKGEILTYGYFPLYLEGPSVWLSTGTWWNIDIHFHGILLFHGKRIDQPGEVRFNYRTDPPDRFWIFSTHDLASVNATKGRYYISFGISPRIQSPGCYAIQVDGQSFSEVIVIQVVQATR